MEKPIDAVLFENDGDSSQGGQGCLHQRLRLTVDSTALTAAHVDGEPSPNDATSSDGAIYFTAAPASKWATAAASSTTWPPQGGHQPKAPSSQQGGFTSVTHTHRTPALRECGNEEVTSNNSRTLVNEISDSDVSSQRAGGGGFPAASSACTSLPFHFTHPPPAKHSVDTCVHPPLTKVFLGAPPSPLH